MGTISAEVGRNGGLFCGRAFDRRGWVVDGPPGSFRSELGRSHSVSSAVIDAFASRHGLSLDGVKDLDGLTFKRAQMLGFGGKPLLQLAYVTDRGVPVALCIVGVDDTDRMAQAGRHFGLASVDWVNQGTGFVLIGDVPAKDLDRVKSSLPPLG